MKYTTKDIAIIGIGIALFVALSMCLRVPVFCIVFDFLCNASQGR